MSFLLDTHIWIWSLLEPRNLSQRVTRTLESSASELWLSPISTWELLILVERGRIVLHSDVDVWLDEAMKQAPMREAPITHEIARGSRHVELEHQDPADRFLLATAKVLDLTLITADRRLTGVPGVKALAN